MAITFTNSTNRIATNFTTNYTQLSIAFRCLFNGTGGNGVGRIYDKSGNTVTNNEYIFFDGTDISIRKAFGVGAGQLAESRIAQTVDSVWHSFVITYDRSSISNTAIFYRDNTIPTVTKTTSGTGNSTSGGNAFVFGNNGGGARGFDGILSDIAIWTKIVPADKALMISDKYSPLIELDGLIYYNRGIDIATQDIVGNFTNTVTGTTITEHPPVIYRS
jgi:Concanavalin A-like lectin/glucanases superfamily